MIDFEIQHQQNEALFFISLDNDQRAYLKYRHLDSDSNPGRVDFYSTFVPDAYRGKGLAAKLVNYAFEWAEYQGLTIDTSCWYAAKLAARRA